MTHDAAPHKLIYFTKDLTPQQINDNYKEAVEKNPERRDYYSEVSRARFILLGNPSENAVKILQRYLVPNNVIVAVTGETPTVERKEKRSDKYTKIIQWCHEHHREQITVYSVADIGEMSYPTALKFVNDRPDLFYKIKKGLYEARNPEISRQEEKHGQ